MMMMMNIIIAKPHNFRVPDFLMKFKKHFFYVKHVQNVKRRHSVMLYVLAIIICIAWFGALPWTSKATVALCGHSPPKLIGKIIKYRESRVGPNMQASKVIKISLNPFYSFSFNYTLNQYLLSLFISLLFLLPIFLLLFLNPSLKSISSQWNLTLKSHLNRTHLSRIGKQTDKQTVSLFSLYILIRKCRAQCDI